MSVSAKPTLSQTIAEWRDGSDGFFQFLADVEPRVPSGRGGFIPFVPGSRERAEIARALDGDGVSVAIFCWPRRHGKTVTNALLLGTGVRRAMLAASTALMAQVFANAAEVDTGEMYVDGIQINIFHRNRFGLHLIFEELADFRQFLAATRPLSKSTRQLFHPRTTECEFAGFSRSLR